MKRFLTIFIAFVLFISAFLFLKFSLEKSNGKDLALPSPNPDVLGVPSSQNTMEVKLNEKTINIVWQEVTNVNNLRLFTNFSSKTSASSFKEKENCSLLTNGSFYSPEGEPIGLFISEYEKLKNFEKNSLLNGIFSVNDFATPRITSEVPKDPLRIALQTGPLLIENSEFESISSKNNESSRRVVVGVTGENKLVFLVLYNPKSFFQGPVLNELPDALKKFNEKSGLILADAVNLDGGSASTFINESISLTEISPVGSFFCVK